MSTTTEPDCGSSSCMFSAKGGMRTNGPCRCMENAGFHGSAVMAAKQMLSEVLLLRARLDAMPHDRTWTKDKPTPGKWWLSIAPEKRTSDDFLAVFGSAVVRCNVYASRTLPGEPVRLSVHLEGQLYFWLTDPWFDGALWMKNEHPADPFAEQPSDNSRDSDLP